MSTNTIYSSSVCDQNNYVLSLILHQVSLLHKHLFSNLLNSLDFLLDLSMKSPKNIIELFLINENVWNVFGECFEIVILKIKCKKQK